MRGFSNRAFVAPKPHETWEGNPQVAFEGHPRDLPHLPPLAIAKRFAPRIVTSQETISGETSLEQPIAMSWDLAKRSFAQGFACLWNIVRVLFTRAKLRLHVAYHRVMQSRHCAWALAAWGWSFSCCLGLMLVVK